MKKRWGLIAVSVLCLIPLLWFKKGYLIGGVDFDMPLFPVRQFFFRTFTWNPVLLGGSDYSMLLAGLYTFTATQALLKAIGLSLAAGQRIYFIFWYALSGFSMYFFISALIKGNDIKAKIIRLSAAVFYMINFYQLHIWMIARKPELSGAIVIPLVLGLLIRAFRRKIPNWKLAGYMAVFSWLGSGMGNNPPVLGIFFISIFSIFLCRLSYVFFIKLEKKEMLRDFKILGIVLGVFILINLYWILPVANYIIQSGYTDSAKIQDVFALKSLLEITSRHNSFLNVIRVYGDANWFDGFKGEPYMPFFPTYQTNILLIILSFMLPILAYSAILFSRHRYVIFFSLLVYIATFLGKGIHPPFGNIFLWMYKHIPGFWIYRAPWQKFGLLMILGYSFLAGITCGKIYEYLQNRISLHRIATKSIGFLKLWKAIPASCIIGIIVLNIGYNYAFVFGKMLPTTEERKTLPGYHQKYPQYLFDSADWINSQKEDFKMVLLPDDRANAYEWGYGGAYDITLKLFDKGLIFRQYGEGMSPPHSLDRLYETYVSALYNNVTPNIAKILGLLNVRYLMHRNDFLYDWSGDSDSPQFIRSRLGQQKGIHLERSIGQWDFYRVECEQPHIYASSDITYVEGGVSSLPSLVSSKDFDLRSTILFSDYLPGSNDFISQLPSRRASVPTKEIVIPSHDGETSPIELSEIPLEDPFKARSYSGWKEIINASGSKDSQAIFIFASSEECPYTFLPGNPAEHNAYNSTLVYIKTGSKPLKIDRIYADGAPANDIVGVWWETGWVGMATKSILYPIVIPANQRAVIQINHLVNNEVTLKTSPFKVNWLSPSIPLEEEAKVALTYRKVNQTRYIVRANARKPFILIFCERYHPQWKAYLKKTIDDNSQIQDQDKKSRLKGFEWSALISAWRDRGKRIEIKDHFMANGYANGWFISKSQIPNPKSQDNEFEIVLEYIPQRLFEFGATIAILTFVGCIGCFRFSLIRHKKRKGK